MFLILFCPNIQIKLESWNVPSLWFNLHFLILSRLLKTKWINITVSFIWVQSCISFSFFPFLSFFLSFLITHSHAFPTSTKSWNPQISLMICDSFKHCLLAMSATGWHKTAPKCTSPVVANHSNFKSKVAAYIIVSTRIIDDTFYQSMQHYHSGSVHHPCSPTSTYVLIWYLSYPWLRSSATMHASLNIL